METIPTDFDGKYLLCRRGKEREARLVRFYKLTDPTIELIKAIDGRDKIFPWPYSKNSMFRKFGDVVARAGLGVGWERTVQKRFEVPSDSEKCRESLRSKRRRSGSFARSFESRG